MRIEEIYPNLTPTLYKVNHARALEMRREMTEAEKVVWEMVRGNKLGAKFRRQQTIGEYIADFYCVEKSLVIEVDGKIHLDPIKAKGDEARDRWMEKKGIKVVRVKNEEVMTRPDEVKERLVEVVRCDGVTSSNLIP